MTIVTTGITLSDLDIDALNDELSDIDQWVIDAVRGKIDHCKTKLDDRWRRIFDADITVTSIPAQVNERVKMIIARSDYKNRVVRDAEEAAKAVTP